MVSMRKVHPHQEIVGLSGLTAEDFWIWAYSDMLDNSVRNAFAEFLVGFVLGRLNRPRPGQASIGFDYRDKRVTVKAASYTQNKPQRKKSKINFDIAVRKNKQASVARPGAIRPSDCYVFCLFTYEQFNDKDAARNALLDTAYWRFYVIATEKLDALLPKHKTVGVAWLDEYSASGAVTFPELKRWIDEVLGFGAE